MLNFIGKGANQVCIEQGFTLLIEEDGNGHAPRSLARNTPVRTSFQKPANAIATPFGSKGNLVERTKTRVSDFILIQRYEPLIHRPEYNRRLATPAMRILMTVMLEMKQGVVVSKKSEYAFICLATFFLFENRKSDKACRHLPVIEVATGIIQGAIDIHTVSQPCQVIV